VSATLLPAPDVNEALRAVLSETPMLAPSGEGRRA
jgi:hypothetical protein